MFNKLKNKMKNLIEKEIDLCQLIVQYNKIEIESNIKTDFLSLFYSNKVNNKAYIIEEKNNTISIESQGKFYISFFLNKKNIIFNFNISTESIFDNNNYNENIAYSLETDSFFILDSNFFKNKEFFSPLNEFFLNFKKYNFVFLGLSIKENKQTLSYLSELSNTIVVNFENDENKISIHSDIPFFSNSYIYSKETLRYIISDIHDIIELNKGF